jgi:hypothetical protein
MRISEPSSSATVEEELGALLSSPKADGGVVGTSTPSSSAAVEGELRALLSLTRQMAAHWEPQRSILQPPWRKSSGPSSPSRGRWRRGRDLGALLFRVFPGGFKWKRGLCSSLPMERSLCLAAMIPAASRCTHTWATLARTWSPCGAVRTVPPEISHSWRTP